MKPRGTLGSREETYLTSVALAWFPKGSWFQAVPARSPAGTQRYLGFSSSSFFNRSDSLVSKPVGTNTTFSVIHLGVNGNVATNGSRCRHLLFCRILTDNAQKALRECLVSSISSHILPLLTILFLVVMEHFLVLPFYSFSLAICNTCRV